ncbi:971_t:CDS:1, partial [Dentiscutata erythropus]
FILDLSKYSNKKFFQDANQIFTQLPIDACKSNQLLLEAIIEGGAPLLFVEACKFQEFVYSINHWYHVLVRKQLSNSVLDNVYENVQASIQQFICKSNWITITTDG